MCVIKQTLGVLRTLLGPGLNTTNEGKKSKPLRPVQGTLVNQSLIVSALVLTHGRGDVVLTNGSQTIIEV